MTKNPKHISKNQKIPKIKGFLGPLSISSLSYRQFETVVDEIASGLDPSGSNYITSSSYANGILVRAGGRNSDITTTNTSSVPSTSGSSATTPSSFSGSTSSAGSSY